MLMRVFLTAWSCLPPSLLARASSSVLRGKINQSFVFGCPQVRAAERMKVPAGGAISGHARGPRVVLWVACRARRAGCIPWMGLL